MTTISDLATYASNQAKLEAAIRAVCPTLESFDSNGGIIAPGATAEQLQAALDAIAEFNSDAGILSRSKAAKCATIDSRTREIIAAGFTFDSHSFSLSPAAQQNWTVLFIMADELSYPKAVTTIDDNEYQFANAAALRSFCEAARVFVNDAYDSGRALKVAANACATLAELEQITDER